MTTRKISLLVAGLIFPLVLGAQYTDFDLSKYKLPDIKLNRLDASFNMVNSGNSHLSQTKFDTSKVKHNNLDGRLNLGYYYFRNTEKYQGNLSTIADIHPLLYYVKTDNNDNRNTSSDINFMINSINRFYNRNLFFLEVDPLVSYYSDRSKNRVENSTTTENTDHQVSTDLSASVSVGYGRIEPVEDLRLAIYILEELQKAGRIESVPPEDIIIEMAREISRIKKKRFFDTRLRKIEELHVVDSFLIANNIISSNDIIYFAVLNDNWDYAAGPARETGFRVNAGIGNDIEFYRFNVKNTVNGTVVADYKNYSNDYNVSGFINAEYAKPLNLYWQTAAGITTSYGIHFIRNPLDKENGMDNYETNAFETAINGLVQYLPNSRTTIGLGLTGTYNYSYTVKTLTALDPDGYWMKSSYFYIIPSFDMYYYVSPRLRVSFVALLSGINSLDKVRYESVLPEEENLTKWYNHSVNLTLTYSFF